MPQTNNTKNVNVWDGERYVSMPPPPNAYQEQIAKCRDYTTIGLVTVLNHSEEFIGSGPDAEERTRAYRDELQARQINQVVFQVAGGVVGNCEFCGRSGVCSICGGEGR